jgi:hypothetical protein
LTPRVKTVTPGVVLDVESGGWDTVVVIVVVVVVEFLIGDPRQQQPEIEPSR